MGCCSSKADGVVAFWLAFAERADAELADAELRERQQREITANGLLEACWRGDPVMIKALMRDEDQASSENFVNWADESGNRPLHLVIAADDHARPGDRDRCVLELLTLGADPEADADALAAKALQRPTNSYDKWNSIGREEEYEELVTELKDVSSSVKDLGIPVKAEAGADAGDGGPLEITDGMSFQEMTEVVRGGHLYLAQPPLYRLTAGKESRYARDDAHRAELEATVFKGKKVDVGRFKGLGEMNPAQLRETTMNPATRSLIRITLPPEFEDRAKVKELVDQLMGRNPEHRFNFIQNNAGDMDREMIDA